MPLKLRPLSDRLVVKPDTPESRTIHGIHIPASAKERPMSGTVVAAGPGYMSDFPVITEKWPMKMGSKNYTIMPEQLRSEFKRMPMEIKTGDRILYGKYNGVEVEIEREKFVIIRQTEVFGLLETEEIEENVEPQQPV